MIQDPPNRDHPRCQCGQPATIRRRETGDTPGPWLCWVCWNAITEQETALRQSVRVTPDPSTCPHERTP